MQNQQSLFEIGNHFVKGLIVKIDNAARIYHAAKHPKSFVSLDGADHLLTRKQDAAYTAQMIATWASRYITFVEEPDEDLHTDKDVLVRTGKEGYTSQVLAGRHHLISDEPAEVGGSDLGPTPYHYLLTALGACTSMTLRMYADRKGWELDEVDVHLSHYKDHVKDCENCENETRKIDVMERSIEVSGILDESQQKRLREIADKCPVHKTLEEGIHIKTHFKMLANTVE